MAALETATGIVSKVNATGFQLDGSEWYSISKFAKPAPAIPAVGARVVVGVDGKGFARTVVIAGPHPVDDADGPQRTALAPRSPDVGAPERAQYPPPDSSLAPSKDTTITGLACVHAATRYLAPRADAKAADILRVAACLEQWVLRP